MVGTLAPRVHEKLRTSTGQKKVEVADVEQKLHGPPPQGQVMQGGSPNWRFRIELEGSAERVAAIRAVATYTGLPGVKKAVGVRRGGV